MGANIGTTITEQIIRLSSIESKGSLLLTLCNTDALAPAARIVGIILITFVKKQNAKTIGDIFIGFGILFIGLDLINGAVGSLQPQLSARSSPV